MDTLQKLFNHIVGIHEPWYARSAVRRWRRPAWHCRSVWNCPPAGGAAAAPCGRAGDTMAACPSRPFISAPAPSSRGLRHRGSAGFPSHWPTR